MLADQAMQRGYLVSKSAFEKLVEFEVDQKTLDEQNDKKEKDKSFNMLKKEEKIKVIKCPLTGHLVEKAKVRKVFFC